MPRPSRSILILSQPGDLHAFAVAIALREHGADPRLWMTSDFPHRSRESVLFENGLSSVRVDAPDLTLRDPQPHVIWNRRPAYVIDKTLLHPADHEYAESACRLFRRGFFDVIAPDAFWVNPNRAVIFGKKIRQHQLALGVGLELPDTLFSNDPVEIRRFLDRHGDRAVFKNERVLPWRDGDENWWFFYTTIVGHQDLNDEDMIQATPGIFQEVAPKAYELRVTFMGRRAFAAKIHSQNTEHGKMDWRRSYRELKMEAIDLPPDVYERCIRLMERLGIVFGCFDFIVTPDGRHLFLEVNQMGQFLFVERRCDIPLLDAMAAFLSQGRVDFEWKPERARIWYRDVSKEAITASEAAADRHVNLPESAMAYWESPAPSADSAAETTPKS